MSLPGLITGCSMLRISGLISTPYFLFALLVNLPLSLSADSLAFKLNGIGSLSSGFSRVDLFRNGQPRYYTSRNGKALVFNIDQGKMVEFADLPATVGATGCPIKTAGSYRPNPIFAAADPDITGAAGTYSGELRFVDLVSGQTLGPVFRGTAPYSRLGRKLIDLGESVTAPAPFAYIAASEERTPNSTEYVQVRIYQVSSNSAVNSCTLTLNHRGYYQAPVMTKTADFNNDGVNELLVVSPSCSAYNCNPVHVARLLDPASCTVIRQQNLAMDNQYGMLRQITELGDYYSNGKQHAALSITGHSPSPNGFLQILEVSPNNISVVSRIFGPTPDFGTAMAYNGQKLAISSPYKDYYPNINVEEGAIYLVNRGSTTISEVFGGGNMREYNIGGKLEFFERDGHSLLGSWSQSINPVIDFLEINQDFISLSGTACADFQELLTPQIQVSVSFTSTSIDFTISGLDTASTSRTFFLIDAGNPYVSQPFVHEWGQSCRTTMNFSGVVSSNDLAVSSSGVAHLSLPYTPGTQFLSERDFTGAAVQFVVDANQQVHFRSSEELHFVLP